MKTYGWTEIISETGMHEAAAYVVYAVLNENCDFDAACENENLYGDRPDIVSERELAARVIKELRRRSV